MTVDRRKIEARAVPASEQGAFGLPGMVTEHHPAGCDCRRCRRLWAADRRRRRKRVARDGRDRPQLTVRSGDR